MVWHVDKHEITFKLTNDKFQKSLSRPSIIDARAHYWAAAQRLRSIAVKPYADLWTKVNSTGKKKLPISIFLYDSTL
jgi:hypothetical protein